MQSSVAEPSSISIHEIINSPSDQVSYKIEKIALSDNCWMEYPQIDGFTDAKLQNSINLYLEQTISEVFCNGENLEAGYSELYYTISCEVKLCNNKLISSAYYLIKTWEGSGMHSCDAFTINIDLLSGEIFDSEQFYILDNGLLDMIIVAANSVERPGAPFSDEWTNFLSMAKVQASDTNNHIFSTQDHLGICSTVNYSLLGEFIVPYSTMVAWEKKTI